MGNLVLATCLLLLANCSPHSVGPNYNQGRTHNKSKENRMRIVYKEDIRMKREVIKARKSASPKTKRKKSNKTRKIIN
jgi:hypothetical protein